MSEPNKAAVAKQFGRMAVAYAASPEHARGADLTALIELLVVDGGMSTLDVAAGAGHTALALASRVRSITAVDLSPEMLAQVVSLARAKGISTIQTQVMDAEALTFPDLKFDIVTCRLAAHHFQHVRKALREMARVLRHGGQLGLEDSCCPADPQLDEFINHVDWLHDRTHVRSYRRGEWEDMLHAAGLIVTNVKLYRKRHAIADWVQRSGISPAEEAEVQTAFSAADVEMRAYFEIQFEEEKAIQFSDDKIILRAIKV